MTLEVLFPAWIIFVNIRFSIINSFIYKVYNSFDFMVYIYVYFIFPIGEMNTHTHILPQNGEICDFYAPVSYCKFWIYTDPVNSKFTPVHCMSHKTKELYSMLHLLFCFVSKLPLSDISISYAFKPKLSRKGEYKNSSRICSPIRPFSRSFL